VVGSVRKPETNPLSKGARHLAAAELPRLAGELGMTGNAATSNYYLWPDP
jgi:hypothetical protein